MALDGVDPLDLGGWTPGRLDELKFDDRLGVQVEGAISARWMDAGKDLEDLQLYISLFRDTLKRDPTIRLSSLATVRKRVFGEQVFLSFAHGCSKCPIVLLTVGRDPYARQKVTDRFRVRHLTNSCELSLV
jgi:hypothetical protein